MKPETFQTLTVAKTLLHEAEPLCLSENKYASSAGIVILQDGLELVLLGCLLEIDADQEKKLEALSFDEMIAELSKRGRTVTKSGNLRALNKQRVITKHYGQLAEPATVRRYWETAQVAIHELLLDVVGKSLPEILLHELISPGGAKTFIEEACKLSSEQKYYDALVAIRKAIFLEVEYAYMIDNWRDVRRGELSGPLLLLKRGEKAPHYTRNREWIEENVTEPFDYVQLDDEAIRLNLLEWGASTQDFYNLLRLTPRVVLLRESGWQSELRACFFGKAVTAQIVDYCLDRVVALLIAKQRSESRLQSLSGRLSERFKMKTVRNTKLCVKAANDSEIRQTLSPEIVFEAIGYVPSLNGVTPFIHAYDIEKELFGYIPSEDCIEASD